MSEIELRSEKVRKIIGKIPSMVTRVGIVAIFLVFTLTYMGLYFVRIPKIINDQAYIEPMIDSKGLVIHSMVPAREKKYLKKGLPVTLKMHNDDKLMLTGCITKIDSILHVKYDKTTIDVDINCKRVNSFVIDERVMADLTIYCGKVTALEFLLGK